MTDAADLAVARRAFRQVRVGALVWAVVFGLTAATSALTYVTSFPDRASRLEIATTTGRDAGLAILLGPVAAIDTVGGYTVYKCFVFLTTIGAVWGLLAATRLLRGEEDTGRWSLILAGGTRAPRATLATLVALFAGVLVLFVGTAASVALAGRDPDVALGLGGSVVYGASVALVPAVFVGVGALTSQLARTRRLATGLGMAVFGVAFVVRMLADSGRSTKWLLWLTPFGWTERMRPFTDDDLRPFVLAAVVVAALVVGSIVLSSRRDVGDGVLATSDVVAPRPFGLGSPIGLATRTELPVLVAWCTGTVAAALSFGIIAKIAAGSVPDSLGDTLRKFGVEGAFVRQYLGVAFLLVATVVALLPASQIGAAAEEETTGRLVHLLGAPVRRTTLLAGRLALAATGVVVAGALAGAFSWIGARSQGVHIGFGSLLGAGLNVVPTGLLVLGVGAVAVAVFPRFATAAVYAVVVASLVIDLLASLVSGIAWLSRLSVFHYMALAPAQRVDAVSVMVTLAVALALCAAATVAFARRDVGAG